jgi:hypothetical protein
MPYWKLWPSGFLRIQHISVDQHTQPTGEWISLAGGLYSMPSVRCAAGRNQDGRLDVFGLGTNSDIWHRWQDDGAPGGWSDWSSFGGPSSQPVASSFPDGRQVVFARGPGLDIRGKSQSRVNGDHWTDWWSLGGIAHSEPVVARDGLGRLEVFYVGSNTQLWHRRQKVPNGGVWEDEYQLGTFPSQGIDGAPAVGRGNDGLLHVFAVAAADGSIWLARQITPGGAWSDWAEFGRLTAVGRLAPALAVGLDGDELLEVFCRAKDGTLWYRSQVAVGRDERRWSTWKSLGGKFAGPAAVGYDGEAHADVVIRGEDGFLWHLPGARRIAEEREWGKWDVLAGFRISNDPVLGLDRTRRLQAFVRGADAALWYRLQLRPGGPWQ